MKGKNNNKNSSLKLDDKKTPPPFTLEIGFPANNIEKQLKKQKILFEPTVIKKYDKLIKSIFDLKNEEIIDKKKCQKLVFKVYERAIKHVYFINEMSDES
jgi:hypothetical protein